MEWNGNGIWICTHKMYPNVGTWVQTLRWVQIMGTYKNTIQGCELTYSDSNDIYVQSVMQIITVTGHNFFYRHIRIPIKDY